MFGKNYHYMRICKQKALLTELSETFRSITGSLFPYLKKKTEQKFILPDTTTIIDCVFLPNNYFLKHIKYPRLNNPHTFTLEIMLFTSFYTNFIWRKIEIKRQQKHTVC